ncbi:hypothetical protein NDU88_006927 [Pleurodeles waltl]|uniref:Uncharacterized protein n=1 Tax=Pleurodeles waltl TaxID=8319 RepID=A0AAV7UMG7_PLEWA|nr:hypothetical protein NDU88_006927 [Pleurodeles waltl]
MEAQSTGMELTSASVDQGRGLGLRTRDRSRGRGWGEASQQGGAVGTGERAPAEREECPCDVVTVPLPKGEVNSTERQQEEVAQSTETWQEPVTAHPQPEGGLDESTFEESWLEKLNEPDSDTDEGSTAVASGVESGDRWTKWPEREWLRFPTECVLSTVPEDTEDSGLSDGKDK